jgi:transcriptional regulator with XRE-family HTH domain
LSLREVEQASEKVVSNAYLSQLEKGKISKPSPNILHALAAVYGASYEDLMSRAGYFTSEPAHARAATFSVSDVSPDEQKALLDYLAFLRHQRKRP